MSRVNGVPAAVVIVAVLVPMLSAVPTWVGYLEERLPDRAFLGFRYMETDHYTYASFVRQAADEGRLLMENRFTTEPQKGRYLLLYMWLAGKICQLTGLGVPGAWEVLRILSGVAFMFAAWSFAGVFFTEPQGRMLAYLFVAFSGGVGWLFYLITGRPMAFLRDAFNWQWNWSTFGSMFVPMWVAAAALLLVCASLISRGKTAAGGWDRALAAALPPLIWFIHPYTGMAAYLAFGLFPLMPVAGSLWRLEAIPWPRVRANLKLVLPSLLSFVLVALYLAWAQKDEVYAANARNVLAWTPTYSVFLYPFAYGLLLPLAIFGMKHAASIPEKARDIATAWLVSSVFLSTNPFLSGVKFQYLIHLPLALLAAHGVIELRRRSPRAKALSKGAGLAVFGTLLFLNTAFILSKDLPGTGAIPEIYLSTLEIDGMKFLKSQPPGAVLCSSYSGNRVAWLAAKKVYIGHWFLTINIDTKASEVAAFFDARVPTTQKLGWLNQKGIRYVYAGPEEDEMGEVDPALGLTKIYDRGGVSIYAVP